MHIVILGWGSLLWDKHPEFDKKHGPWQFDGPQLKLEFSRISKSRSGALTLVIDPNNGALCPVAYAKSKRRYLEDVICDLRCREGTTVSNIGFLFVNKSLKQSRDSASFEAIHSWAISKKFDVVVWTDLNSNFEEVCGKPFTPETALKHIQALDEEAKSHAAEYMWRAPSFINTPLRNALQTQPWFPK